MSHPTQDTKDWYLKQLEKFVGATVIGSVVDDSDPYDVFVGLNLQMPNKQRFALFFLSDDEGNAGGSFEIIGPTE